MFWPKFFVLKKDAEQWDDSGGDSCHQDKNCRGSLEQTEIYTILQQIICYKKELGQFFGTKKFVY